MRFAVVGLVLVGVVGALNLLILLVVLRRWRELEPPGGSSHQHGAGDGGHQPGIRAGDRLPRFSATSLDGARVTERDLLGQEILTGFFSLTCKACVDAVPLFAGHAERLRESGGTALAIVHGEDAAGSELAGMLTGVADIVIAEDATAALTRRHGARNYPSYARYGPDGVATAAGTGVSSLRAELVAP